MICNRTETGWEIIYQRAHALLAAELIAPWAFSEEPERWTATLSATAQHDNGWQEWEAADRLTPVGTPRDFTETPVDDLVAQSERALQRARHQGLWCALLVSHHVSHLYEPKRDESAALDRLLDRQAAERKRWRKTLEVRAEEVEAAYALLLWGDTFSLALCQRHLPEDGRALELEPTPDGTRTFVARRADGTLGVDPWPYAADHFRVGTDTYRLDQLTFESDDDLAEALREAPVERRSWTVRAD
ncbi:MAG: DUF3891 family protein [Rhodothermales bacterium]|nr:DUF3891 family protein [Rhodothermales bacterium]